MSVRSKKDEEELLLQFREAGYVVLRGFLESEVVQAARSEMEKLVDGHAERLLAAGRIRDLFKQEPFEARLFRLYEHSLDDAPKSFRRELHGPGLYYMFFHTRLLDVVELLLGAEIRLYPNYTARPKLPHWEGTKVLWHQDGGYTESRTNESEERVEQLRMVNVWSPLVPACVENGCMQFIPGSHQLGVVPHEERQYYLEISPEYLEPRLSKAVSIEADPGDLVLFHNLLFHHGLPNRSSTIRWSLDWRYQDANQPTLRRETGHIARSRREPASAVPSAEEWSKLTFR